MNILDMIMNHCFFMERMIEIWMYEVLVIIQLPTEHQSHSDCRLWLFL